MSSRIISQKKLTSFIRLRIFYSTLLAMVLTASALQAKEVDQFTDRSVVRARLLDSGEMIDQKINEILASALIRLNLRPPLGRPERIALVAEQFQDPVLPRYRNLIEEWIFDEGMIPQYRVRYRGIYGGSVNYDNMGMGWYVGLSPIIRVHGVFMGADKIGHFFAQGWEYEEKALELGLGRPVYPREVVPQDAPIGRAIRALGHQTEQEVLGQVGIGVYSFADLAANWQGFRFYEKLFDGERPYFVRNAHGVFELKRRFSFREYVSEDWDETLNPSQLVDHLFWLKVRENFRTPNRAGKSICSDYRAEPSLFELRPKPETQTFWREYHFYTMDEYNSLPNMLRIRDLCSGN